MNHRLLLDKRTEQFNEIERINNCPLIIQDKRSIELNDTKKELIKKYKFFNNLMKAVAKN